MTQKQALDILKTGANVFLTGEPGSGKTYVINEYVKYLRSCGAEPAICASTGIAATHIGGMTIHSWSGIGVANRLSPEEIASIAARSKIKKRLLRTRILIIDEVSMLSGPTLSMVDGVCRAARNTSIPFGGMQVVLVGDFFQLPPISRDNERAIFAYESDSWAAAKPVTCYLAEQYRQDDPQYLAVLAAIRSGNFSDTHRAHIFGQKVASNKLPDDVPKLFPHNADVDRINAERLAKLSGRIETFQMETFGAAPLIEFLKRGCLSPDTLELKTGAAVMCTKNNPKKGFVNGTLGRIVGFEDATGYPLIETRAKARILVEPVEWTIEEDGKVKARVAQIPLRLAWAMTVHKSQGMSMEAAVMDLSDAFEYGQGYVALSRVRRLSGLYLLGANDRAFMVHQDILKKDREFRIASSRAEERLRAFGEEELVAKHKLFVFSCGGKIPASGNRAYSRKGEGASDAENVGSGFDHTRIKYPNAYRPWRDEDDSNLRELFEQGAEVAIIADHFGRKPGAIRSRLVRLGLTEFS